MENKNTQIKIELNNGMSLTPTRMEVVGDISNADGESLGYGNYAVCLSRDDIAALEISNFRPISEKFSPTPSDPENANNI